jgi:hypothetical protein
MAPLDHDPMEGALQSPRSHAEGFFTGAYPGVFYGAGDTRSTDTHHQCRLTEAEQTLCNDTGNHRC